MDDHDDDTQGVCDSCFSNIPLAAKANRVRRRCGLDVIYCDGCWEPEGRLDDGGSGDR